MTISTPLIGAATEHTAETSTLIPYPTSGITSSHIALLFLTCNNASLATNKSSPWTTLKNASATGNTLVPDFYVAWKQCSGSENGTTESLTHPNNVSISQILCFAGVDLTTPIDVTSDFKDPGTGSSVTHSSMTLTKAGCTIVAFGTVSGSGSTSTPTSTWTETLDKNTGTRPGTIVYKQGFASGATGTFSPWTMSGSGNLLGLAVALRPAAAARPGFIKKAGLWVPLDEVLT